MSKFLNLRYLSLVIRFAEGLPFVIRVLTLAERYLHFRQPPLVDKEHQRNDRLSGVLGGFLKFAYLASLQQEFAVASHLVVRVRPEAVLRDVHLLDVHLPVFHRTIAICQRRLPFADGFDLCTEELDAGGVAVENDILKLRLLIQYTYVRLRLHICKSD